jgi:hypothetical protein
MTAFLKHSTVRKLIWEAELEFYQARLGYAKTIGVCLLLHSLHSALSYV